MPVAASSYHWLNPLGLIATCLRHRGLIVRLTLRELEGRFKGSFLGMLWLALVPITLLACYTFVFSFVFGARWGTDASTSNFALVLFSGLIFFNIISEAIARGPTLIVNNQTYVKKVLFPLEILPVVSTLAALVVAGVSSLVLLVFVYVLRGAPPFEALIAPVLFVPSALVALSLSYFLSALGVYIRDLQQATNLMVTALMFLSPIFYPLSAVPEQFQPYILLNPLTWLVEQARGLLFLSTPLSLGELLIFTAVSGLMTWLGFAFFMKTRKGFADVI